MENLLQNLTETLSSMANVYNDILKTAQDKQKYIISGDIDNLESIIYQERNLAENIILLEKKRRYIMQSLNKTLGQDDTTPVLGELIEKVNGPYKNKLKELYDAIKEAIMKLQVINKSNTMLTKHSLKYINNFIRTICSESLNDSTYQQSGEKNEPELKKMLIEVSA